MCLGYLAVIFIGALLLCLPISTENGQATPFIDALFTATSSTCVTGLITVDTSLHWSLFGEIVIICLIQLGGLGLMTFVSVVLKIFGRHFGVYERKLMMISAAEDKRAELRRLFRRILLGTLIFEGLGAAFLSIRFIPDFGVGKGIYYSVWHSISSFCNAGFDLMGGTFGDAQGFVSLTHYAKDPIVTLTVASLIIVGGLGFCVWDDLLEHKLHFKKYALHTKVVFFGTAILVVAGTGLFLLFERNNPSLEGYTFGERMLVSFFASVTPRTAGFNTMDMSTMSDSGYMLTNILMFIGGASGSTAGGIKVTTFAVILIGIASVFRGKKDMVLGNRRLEDGLLRQAQSIFVSCLIAVTAATLAVCAIEENNPAVAEIVANENLAKFVLFESFSAMGTVGLTLGITPHLTVASKLIMMMLMYAGRVGILTVGLAFAEKKNQAEVKKPVGTIFIG